MQQGRHSAGERGFELVHELEMIAIEIDFRRNSVAFWRKHCAAVFRDHIGVRAKGKQVGCRLNRSEARARNDDGAGSRKAFDGRAHCSLELINGGRFLVTRIHGLLVRDHWQGQQASVAPKPFSQMIEPEPEIVGIESSDDD